MDACAGDACSVTWHTAPVKPSMLGAWAAAVSPSDPAPTLRRSGEERPETHHYEDDGYKSGA